MDAPKSVDLETVKLPDQADDLVLYKYRDAQGREIVTNDIASVPPGVKLEPVNEGSQEIIAPKIPDELYGVHLSSAALGLVVGIGIVVLPKLMRRGRILSKLVVMAGALIILGGLYFGWVMRTAGFENAGIVADPRDAVNEATKVKDQANERTKRIEQISDQLEK